MKPTLDELKSLATKKLWSGEYKATDSFKSIQKHASVCFEDGALVAVTGPADDRESQLYASLFADAPAMLVEIAQSRARIAELEAALKEARYEIKFQYTMRINYPDFESAGCHNEVVKKIEALLDGDK